MTQKKLTIYLLKDDLVDPIDVLRDPDDKDLERLPLSQDVAEEGAIFTLSKRARPPGWQSVIRSVSGPVDELPLLSAASPSALVVFEVAEHWFAMTFGQGRHLLKSDCFVRGFGLRATLNLVEHASLRAVDSSEWDQVPKHRRISSARRARIRDFDITHDLELLRGVVGNPEDQDLATQVQGRDAVTLWCEFDPLTLSTKCQSLLDAYEANVDANEYPMFGNIAVVADPTLRAELDEQLLEKLLDDTLDLLDMAPPDVVNWESTTGFRIPDRSSSTDPVLDITTQILEAVKPKTEWRLDWLKSKRLCAVDGNGNDLEQWKVYDCLVAEFVYEGKRFALLAGDWFEIDQNFVNRIEQDLQGIPLYEGQYLGLAGIAEIEAVYNDRSAEESGGDLRLLDKATIAYGGGRSRVEVCDLLHPDSKTLFHVKDKFKSSGMSHLFTQAAVSLELILEDSDFRRKVREAYPDLAYVFPEETPDPSEFTVVLAIISTKPLPPLEQMPFLSKVRLHSLKRTMRRLRLGDLRLHTVERR